MSEEQREDQEPGPESFSNPIDPDKVAENPHLLPYAHTVGSIKIDPVDKGKVKGRAVTAMYEQTNTQLDQIRKQMELLVEQAKELQNRVKISEKIYLADINFEPVIGKIYHLYARQEGTYVLSLVSPEEWGANPPFEFLATMRLLADHTWEVLYSETDQL